MKYTILLLTFFGLVSCDKQNKLTWTERRMIGSWIYEDVDYSAKWSLGKKDITDEFDNLVLTFYDDFTVTSVNQLTGESYSGIWELNVVNSANDSDGNNSATEQLFASLTRDQTGEIVQMVWDRVSVTKKRISSQNDTKDGHYCYKLRKL